MQKVQDATRPDLSRAERSPRTSPDHVNRNMVELRWDLVAVARRRLRNDFYSHPALIEFAAEQLVNGLD